MTERQKIFKRAAEAIERAFTKEEFASFSEHLDNDSVHEFENAVFEIDSRLNPHLYGSNLDE